MKRISASGVLGKYDYVIDFDDDNRVKVIYAENGNGKTNFLKAVGLLCEPGAENLFQLIRNIPIKSLSVEFENQISISITKNRLLDSSATLKINKMDEYVVDMEFLDRLSDFEELSESEIYDEGFYISDSEILDFTENLEALRNLGSNIKLLDAGRIHSSVKKFEVKKDTLFSHYSERAKFKNTSVVTADPVFSVIKNLEDKLIRQAFTGSSKTKTDGVYAEVTKNILGEIGQNYNYSSGTSASNDIFEKIKNISEVSDLVREYGIIDFSEYDSVVAQIKVKETSRSRSFIQLAPAIIPYFDSLYERISIAKVSAVRIDNFIKTVNSMLSGKRLMFDTKKGIQLFSDSGSGLDYPNLSSGERQLIYLLANVTLAATNDGFLIIDEPEISMGIKWQRRLIKSFEQCMQNSNAKILIATHSNLVIVSDGLNNLIKPELKIG